MIWDHKTMVHRTERECQPQNEHRRAWDVNINTGEITQDDPLRVNPRKMHASVGESESGGSDEGDRVINTMDHTSNIASQMDILESIKQECLSKEDATETFMEAYLNDQHHEDHGYTMAEDKKQGAAESLKEILQDCLRILEGDEEDEEDTHSGEEHE